MGRGGPLFRDRCRDLYQRHYVNPHHHRHSSTSPSSPTSQARRTIFSKCALVHSSYTLAPIRQVNSRGRPVFAYSIGRQDRNTRRIVTLYVLGRLLGKPAPCRRCGAESCTTAHMFVCTGVRPPDPLILRGSYRMARECIVRAMRRCLSNIECFGPLING